ncbi:hypothetical protein [Chitinibacter tainanensis]|uniref:hypothetical protein n=1 Tax=Chitinibacter tainanensis TaxID=230667 RepID=UPI000407B4DF|nr:hypothetical protein [Chitinibacter tainanensis]
MPSNTRNVKIGVCQIFFDGVDLGYTKGGVEVSVSTETYDVNIDQFGKTPINQLVTGRQCSVKVPLAETTIDNLVRVMPGANKVGTPGTPATSDVVISTVAANTKYAVTIDGIKYETTSDSSPTQGEVALALVALINANDSGYASASTTANASTNTAATIRLTGKDNNSSFIVSTSGAGFASANPAVTANTIDRFRVDVTSGVGSDLLSMARELRLHPVGKPLGDKSEDFVIPLAGTGGGLQFAYKLEEERVFNVEFKAYAHPSTKLLFSFGDAA